MRAVAALAVVAAVGWPGAATTPAAAPTPAPPAVVRELSGRLASAAARFEARDAEGVLAAVSEQYRTGPVTKPVIREQLNAIYGLYDQVAARVRIDDVQMVGDHAWVYSSGEVSGRLRLLGEWVVFLSWQRELEVARREGGTWKLYGYQQ